MPRAPLNISNSRNDPKLGDYERIYRQYYKPIPVRSSSKVKNNDEEYKPNDIQEIKHHLVKFEDLIR